METAGELVDLISLKMYTSPKGEVYIFKKTRYNERMGAKSTASKGDS
jgi:hypothetical protein